MRLSYFLTPLLDFCYPKTCVSCSTPCDGPAVWCNVCTQAMEKLAHIPACPKCAMPLAQAAMPCPYCLNRGLHPYHRIIRLGLFADPLRRSIHHTKYHRRWELGEHLANRLYEIPGVADLLARADGLLPVPLHWRRHIGRGYNQAQVLAAQLARRAHRPVLHAAVRAKNTPTQTHLHSRSQRQANLRDAFVLRNPHAIAAKRIIVVDDVMTTGATLQSLGRVLHKANPVSLDALVLAIADPRGQGFQRI